MGQGKSIRQLKEEARLEARRKARQRSRGGAATQSRGLTFIILNSVGVATVGTLLMVLLFRVAVSLDSEIDPDLQRLVVMLGFIILFLATLLFLIKKYMPANWMLSQEERLKGKAQGFVPPDEKWGGALVPSTESYDKVFDDAHARTAEVPASLDDQVTFTEPKEEAPPPDEPEGGSLDNDDQTVPVMGGPGGPGPQPESEEPVEGNENTDDDTPTSTTDSSTEDSSGEAKKADDATMAQVLDQLKHIILDVTQTLQSRETQIDSFTKFGLNLYFAGACSRLTKHFSLSADEGKASLARLMELTGVSKQAANEFSESVNGYGQNPQYRKMIDSGDAAISRHLNESSVTGPSLNELLDEWCDPENDIEIPTMRTFMFTEIVDSVGLTEELGSMTMREVVRTHDEIVRKALEAYSGEEAKHTGDGIMATFELPHSAIEAAVQIQQETELYGREEPGMAFDVRVGIHTGEAIKQGGEYSGESVRTAAGVCAEASGQEIWASDDLFRACPKYADDLRYRGDFKIPGLSEEQMLHEALWERLPDRKSGKVDYQEIGRS